jgi:hypothetical protein
MVADALIDLVLDDRRTDDPLLTAAQACCAACEQLRKEVVEQSVQPGSLRMLSRIKEAYEPRRDEAKQRCREAWIRWLDQQATPERS